MQVDVIIDVVCPWCYIGKRRLEEAQRGTDIQFDAFYRPFLLAPDMPREGKDRKQHFAEKFGPDADLSKMTSGLLSQAGDLDFRFEEIERVPNTIDAHRLIYWARGQGVQAEVVEGLFKAYFTDGQDIGRADVLAGIAGACGMDVQIVSELLAGEKDRDTMRNGAMQATGMGIQGVPFYIFAGKVALSGAQPADMLIKAAEKAREAEAA